MGLKAIVKKNRDKIIQQWIEAVNGTYPFNTIGFLRTNQNQFINPIGNRTQLSAAIFTDSLTTDTPDEPALHEAIEDFIKIRAIQDFSAEAAVGILYAFKPIIREVTGGQLAEYIRTHGPAEFFELEGRIDSLAIMAFGVYAKCREQLINMRMEEFQRRHFQVLRHAKRMFERENPGKKLEDLPKES